MDATQGWIKIHRSMLDKGWFINSDYLVVWMYLLMEAYHKDSEYLWNGKTIILKRGQFITGRNKLSKELKINRSKVDRILKFFESEQQIEQQMTSTSRLISILNYEKYQGVEPPSEPRVSHKRATSEPQVSTKEELNNDNNKNNSNKPKKKKSSETSVSDLSYQPCLDFWLKEFHPDFKFTGKEGKALKEIIAEIQRRMALKNKEVTQESTLEGFEFLCLNLPTWFKNKDLSTINSKINEVLEQIINANNTNNQEPKFGRIPISELRDYASNPAPLRFERDNPLE
jgi:DNA replication protein DnaD